jgi:LPPG:FO 2-phospho-L-lactate transferase
VGAGRLYVRYVRIAVLAGGIGGAKFLRGVRAAVPQDEITAIVNTGDDVTLHGLRICPDLDSVMYTLAGVHDTERGWGRADESWRVMSELAEYGAEPGWFSLGDLDIGTHLVRTRMLDAGFALSDVTTALCARWQIGARILPMTDQRCETHVIVDDTDAAVTDGGPRRKAIHFQEWWIRYRAALRPEAFVQVGVDEAVPAPGVLEAIAAADVVLIAPSNPVVSIGTILGVPGIREAVAAAAGPVIGYSPIVRGAPVRGMADMCLPAIGVEVSAEAVGRHYSSRRDGGASRRDGGGLLDGWLVHESDTADVPGVEVRAIPLLMTSDDASAAMVRAGLDLAAAISAGSRR